MPMEFNSVVILWDSYIGPFDAYATTHSDILADFQDSSVIKDLPFLAMWDPVTHCVTIHLYSIIMFTLTVASATLSANMLTLTVANTKLRNVFNTVPDNNHASLIVGRHNQNDICSPCKHTSPKLRLVYISYVLVTIPGSCQTLNNN